MKTIICVGVSRLYSEGAASLIEHFGNGLLRGVAFCPAECLSMPSAVDLVIVDLPTTTGTDFVRLLHQEMPRVPIFAMVDTTRGEDVAAYVRAGVEGLFAADRSSIHVVASLLAAKNNITRLEGDTSSRDAEVGSHDTSAAALTRRQLQVLELIEKGLSNKEIARTLCVELPTVKNHVHQILSKTRVQRRTQAVLILRDHRDTRRAPSGPDELDA